MWEILKLQHCKRSDSFDKITDMCNGDVMRLDSFFDVPEMQGLCFVLMEFRFLNLLVSYIVII